MRLGRLVRDDPRSRGNGAREISTNCCCASESLARSAAGNIRPGLCNKRQSAIEALVVVNFNQPAFVGRAIERRLRRVEIVRHSVLMNEFDSRPLATLGELMTTFSYRVQWRESAE